MINIPTFINYQQTKTKLQYCESNINYQPTQSSTEQFQNIDTNGIQLLVSGMMTTEAL
jgi:hypothetical protein